MLHALQRLPGILAQRDHLHATPLRQRRRDMAVLRREILMNEQYPHRPTGSASAIRTPHVRVRHFRMPHCIIIR
ncbi:hypothetical protein [Siccirubricoccus sp. G192]|uniref:hypothetical protein n=1 Tax=Siccirubricoccus sp. G192 TaxID=2849651 RepID=UPI0020C3622A|nr:hypothetical protein [Siccirubricoccus sp. G192]